MTDRELLEKASKAVNGGSWHPLTHAKPWNPFADDGDAMRLAVHLHLEITHNHPLDNDAWVMAIPNGQMVGPTEEVDGEENRCAATRRCITRAAAAIGEGKT